tara:strand:+ start:238 stop:642 length:405 start_codon:yes stop_codon:yes gene_type:complete
MKIILEDIPKDETEVPKDKFFEFGEEKVKYIGQIEEKDKGRWVSLTAQELHEQFKSLMQYTSTGDAEIDNVPWNSLNYEPYSADYYEQTTPGFDPAVYEILAESSKAQNAIVDNRIPSMQKIDGSFNPFAPQKN